MSSGCATPTRGPLGPKHQDQHDIRGRPRRRRGSDGALGALHGLEPGRVVDWRSSGPRRVCVWTAEGELKCSLNLASATAVAENEDGPEPYYVLGLCWRRRCHARDRRGSHDVRGLEARATGSLRFSLACHDHEDSIRCLAACNGQAGGGSGDCTVRVWDVTPAPSDIITRGFGAAVTCVCWSPDGALLAAGSKATLGRVARAEAGRQVRRRGLGLARQRREGDGGRRFH